MDHFCYLCYVFVVLSCLFIADLCHLLGKADLLARLYMKFSCVWSLSHLVSRVKCGALLYRFLIYDFLLTLFGLRGHYLCIY